MGRELQGPLRPRHLLGRRTSGSTRRRSPPQFAFYYRPLRRPRRRPDRRHARGDRWTRSPRRSSTAPRGASSATCWPTPARSILAEGNPDNPLDRAEGLPDAHPPAARRAREQARVRPGRASPCSSGPATRRSRSSARTRTTTTSAPRSTGSTTTGSGAPAATRSGSASTCSPAPASAAADRAPAPRCTRSRCTSSRTARFELVISQREHPGNWLPLGGRHPEHRHPPDVPRPTEPAPRRAAHRAPRRRRHRARAAHRGGAVPRRCSTPGFYVKGVAEIGAGVGDPPVPVAERVHRRGRAPRDRQVQGPADQVAPGATSTSPTTRRSSSRSPRPSASTG